MTLDKPRIFLGSSGKQAKLVQALTLQGIASAVLGRQAFEMGWATAALGLAMHFLVALAAAVTFYGLSRRIPAMVEHPVVSGILFGVFWLLVMYRGVSSHCWPRYGRSTSPPHQSDPFPRSGRSRSSSTSPA